MPESWLKKAIRKASAIGRRRSLSDSAPPPSPAAVAPTIRDAVACTCSGVARGSIRASTSSARVRFSSPPFRSSHRGLSGIARQATI